MNWFFDGFFFAKLILRDIIFRTFSQQFSIDRVARSRTQMQGRRVKNIGDGRRKW